VGGDALLLSNLLLTLPTFANIRQHLQHLPTDICRAAQATLRREHGASALFNTTAWVRHWESRLQHVWAMHAAGVPPQHLL
jgi:hypothetical protein